MQGCFPVLGLDKWCVPRDEEGVFDLGRVGIHSGGQQLDGERLAKRLEALDPLQRGGGAAVLQHRPRHRHVLLHRGHREVTVQHVAASLPPHRQVNAVVLHAPVTALLDVYVGGASRDGDHVIVAIPARRTDRKLLLLTDKKLLCY